MSLTPKQFANLFSHVADHMLWFAPGLFWRHSDKDGNIDVFAYHGPRVFTWDPMDMEPIESDEDIVLVKVAMMDAMAADGDAEYALELYTARKRKTPPIQEYLDGFDPDSEMLKLLISVSDKE